MTDRYTHKDPSEAIRYGYDFAPLLVDGDTLLSVTSTIRVIEGEDASAAAMLSGTVAINGSKVSQLVINGVVGVTYKIGFSATTSSSQTFIEAGLLQVLERD